MNHAIDAAVVHQQQLSKEQLAQRLKEDLVLAQSTLVEIVIDQEVFNFLLERYWKRYQDKVAASQAVSVKAEPLKSEK